MSNTSPSSAPEPTQARGSRESPQTMPRLVLMVAAVVLAFAGLLCLSAVLVTAFLQGEVWPGFLAGAYFCLPLAFVLMMLLVISGVRARRRA